MENMEAWQWPNQTKTEVLPNDSLSITIKPDLVEKGLNELQGFAQMQQVYQGAIQAITTKLEILDAEFRVRYAHNPIHHIVSRLKNPASILQKLRRKGLPLNVETAKENLMDIAGVRVICSYLDDIYDIAAILEQQGDIIPVRRHDYIKNPKENGYRSLHLIVRVPVFLSDRTEMIPVEIQIRTIAMDFWASLEHELRYKSSEEVSEDVRERLKQCAETSAYLDQEMQAIRTQCVLPEQ